MQGGGSTNLDLEPISDRRGVKLKRNLYLPHRLTTRLLKYPQYEGLTPFPEQMPNGQTLPGSSITIYVHGLHTYVPQLPHNTYPPLPRPSTLAPPPVETT